MSRLTNGTRLCTYVHMYVSSRLVPVPVSALLVSRVCFPCLVARLSPSFFSISLLFSPFLHFLRIPSPSPSPSRPRATLAHPHMARWLATAGNSRQQWTAQMAQDAHQGSCWLGLSFPGPCRPCSTYVGMWICACVGMWGGVRQMCRRVCDGLRVTIYIQRL